MQIGFTKIDKYFEEVNRFPAFLYYQYAGYLKERLVISPGDSVVVAWRDLSTRELHHCSVYNTEKADELLETLASIGILDGVAISRAGICLGHCSGADWVMYGYNVATVAGVEL